MGQSLDFKTCYHHYNTLVRSPSRGFFETVSREKTKIGGCKGGRLFAG